MASCTAVLQYMNYVVPVTVQGNEVQLFLGPLSLDQTVASVAAKKFAESKSLAFKERILPPLDSVVLIAKYGQQWFPLQLRHDRGALIRRCDSLDFSGEESEARSWAETIASLGGYRLLKEDCIELSQRVFDHALDYPSDSCLDFNASFCFCAGRVQGSCSYFDLLEFPKVGPPFNRYS